MTNDLKFLNLANFLYPLNFAVNDYALISFLYSNVILIFLQINRSALQFRLNQTDYPSSRCSPRCKFNEIKKEVGSVICCWTCTKCPKWHIRPTEYKCLACPEGTIPSKDLKVCQELPLEYLKFFSPGALSAACLASFGIITTLFVMAVFCRRWDTAVVKGH